MRLDEAIERAHQIEKRLVDEEAATDDWAAIAELRYAAEEMAHQKKEGYTYIQVWDYVTKELEQIETRLEHLDPDDARRIANWIYDRYGGEKQDGNS